MRRLAIFSLALASFAALPVVAQDENQKKVDQVFSQYDKPGSPGCAVGVIRNGNFLYRKGYGFGSIELSVPLSSQSVFYMGSVSKQFTAASVVLAAEQGLLSLDDEVHKFLPELPDYGHPITIRQMLNHTSGLRDFLTLMDVAGLHAADIHSREEMLELIFSQKGLNNIPGDEYIYSNTNYFLAGEIVQRVSKKSLAQFANDNIFQPLGMSHTRFYDDRSLIVPNRVAAYSPGKDGKFLVDWSTNFDTVGAGGLMSSVDDLLLWDRNFYENKLGKGTLWKEMLTRGVLNNGKTNTYALGVEVSSYRGLPTVEHDGALFGYRTVILRFPEQKFSAVALCNVSTANTSALAQKIADVYLDSQLKPEPVPSAAPNSAGLPDVSTFAGKYLDPRTQLLYTFTSSNGQLMAWGSPLRRINANQFHDLSTGIITFTDSANGKRATLDLDGNLFFSGGLLQPMHLTESNLKEFAGIFFSQELETNYILSVANGKLVMRCGWNPIETLTPLAPDEFQAENESILVFRRGSDHSIIGLSVFAGNVRNLSFAKQP